MIVSNSSTVMDGLVFSIDANNPKSYSGPPISNVLTGINPSSIYDNGSTYRAFSGTEDVYIPSYGLVKDCKFVDWYNDYNGGSNNCCPNMYNFGSPTLSGNTVYTYGILYRSVNRYTNPNLMYHYEYMSNGGYLTEFGVHNGGYSWQETHLGNGWYWSRAKFTTNPSTAYGNFYTFMYQYATWNRLYVAAVALMPGDYTELHPKYWPALGTSRSSTTEVIKDLTGRNILEASNLAYASDGTFSFNGSTSVIFGGASTNYLPMPNFTLESWHKCTGIASGMNISSPWGLTYGITGNIYSDGSTAYSTYNSDTSTTFSSVSSSGVNLIGGWHHVVYVVGSTTSYLYIDGVLNSSSGNNGSWSGTNAWAAMQLQIGNNPNDYYYRFLGNIGVARIYNRALSASEVKQNFSALRGRYGI